MTSSCFPSFTKLFCLFLLLLFFSINTNAYSQSLDGVYVVGDDNHRISIHGDKFSLLSIPAIVSGNNCRIENEELSMSDDVHIKLAYQYICDNNSVDGEISIDNSGGSLSFNECIISTWPKRSDNCMISIGGTLEKVSDSEDSFPDKDRYSIQYCRAFKPGGRYMTIIVPEDPAFNQQFKHSNVQISSALKQTYFEQLGLTALSGDYPQLNEGSSNSLEKAVETAMGFDKSGPGIVLPFDWTLAGVSVKVKVLNTEDVSAFSDENNKVFITKGLIERIVKDAAIRNFGSIDKYASHLSDVLNDKIIYPELYNPINVVDGYVDPFNPNSPGEIPIGALVYSWSTRSDSSEYGLDRLDGFAMDISSALFFVGAHEAGHLAKKHHAIKLNSCDDFRNIETDADAYASRKLASFIFGMMPWNKDNFGTILDQRHFFQIYDSLGFSDHAMSSECSYPPSPERLAKLNEDFSKEFDRLLHITMASTRYDQAFGGASCQKDGSLDLDE